MTTFVSRKLKGRHACHKAGGILYTLDNNFCARASVSAHSPKGMTLRATSLLLWRSYAIQKVEKPPAPSLCSTRYLPLTTSPTQMGGKKGPWVILYIVFELGLGKVFNIRLLFFIAHEVAKVCRVIDLCMMRCGYWHVTRECSNTSHFRRISFDAIECSNCSAALTKK